MLAALAVARIVGRHAIRRFGGVTGDVIALFGMETDEPDLLLLEPGNEGGLGVLTCWTPLGSRLRGFNGLCALLHVCGAELDGALAVA